MKDRGYGVIDVPALVEKPHIYILGRCIAKDVKQLGYSQTRCQCLDELQNNLLTSKGCPVTDIMRFFHTNGPGQQFESGEQRGGNNGCSGCSGDSHRYRYLTYRLRSPHLSLADRIKIVRAGPAGEGKEIEESSPSKHDCGRAESWMFSKSIEWWTIKERSAAKPKGTAEGCTASASIADQWAG